MFWPKFISSLPACKKSAQFTDLSLSWDKAAFRVPGTNDDLWCLHFSCMCTAWKTDYKGNLTLSTGELLSDPFAIKNWKFNEFFQIFLGLTYMITWLNILVYSAKRSWKLINCWKDTIFLSLVTYKRFIIRTLLPQTKNFALLKGEVLPSQPQGSNKSDTKFGFVFISKRNEYWQPIALAWAGKQSFSFCNLCFFCYLIIQISITWGIMFQTTMGSNIYHTHSYLDLVLMCKNTSLSEIDIFIVLPPSAPPPLPAPFQPCTIMFSLQSINILKFRLGCTCSHVAGVAPIFYEIFIFSSNDLQKLWKMFFISSKKLFSFSRYSSFCNLFPSFPHSPDSKGQMEVEIIYDVINWLV